MTKQIVFFGILIGILIIVGSRMASAQAVSFGVKGGVALTDPNGSPDESRRYIVGESIEVRLPAGFAVEADVLYRRIGNSSIFHFDQNSENTLFANRLRGNAWEFPILGKYYFRPRTAAWQPFVGTGYAFRTVQFHSDYSTTTTDASGATHTSTSHNDYGSGLGVGAVVAAGVRYHWGRVAFLPELRYTRWGGSDNGFSHKNEAGFLMGISF